MEQIAKTEEYKQTELGELPVDWELEELFKSMLHNLMAAKIKIKSLEV